MTITTRNLAIILSLLTLSASAAEPTPGPRKDIAELAPLDHYAGQWTTEMRLNPSTSTSAPISGKASAEWIHEGRCLRQTWSIPETTAFEKLSGSTVMTYDLGKKTYRSWSFVSNGNTSEATGEWNPKTKSFTWTSRDAENGNTMTTKASFDKEGVETWSIVTKDRDGKALFDGEGKNTRKK